jgi:hypothetical protein
MLRGKLRLVTKGSSDGANKWLLGSSIPARRASVFAPEQIKGRREKIVTAITAKSFSLSLYTRGARP